MRFEVVEEPDGWVVWGDGRELGRFANQDKALHEVTNLLRDADASAPVSLSMRYQSRAA